MARDHVSRSVRQNVQQQNTLVDDFQGATMAEALRVSLSQTSNKGGVLFVAGRRKTGRRRGAAPIRADCVGVGEQSLPNRLK
jgi:hypothetical protein